MNSQLDKLVTELDRAVPDRDLTISEVDKAMKQASGDLRHWKESTEEPSISRKDMDKGFEWAEPAFGALLFPSVAAGIKMAGFTTLALAGGVGLALAGATALAVGIGYVHSRTGESKEKREREVKDFENLQVTNRSLHTDFRQWAKLYNESSNGSA